VCARVCVCASDIYRSLDKSDTADHL